MVGVLLSRQRARNVADDLKDQADGKGYEVPAAVMDCLAEVNDEEDEEPHSCKNGEGEGGRVAVDDDGRIPIAIWVREFGVDIAVNC